MSEVEEGQVCVTENTMLIYLETGQYPVTVYSAISVLRQTGLSVPDLPYVSDLENMGFAVVHPTDRPVGDVVTEGEPTQTDGIWHQVWVVRPFTPEELASRLESAKQTAYNKILDVRSRDWATGIPFTTDSGVSFHVQIRDKDKANLLLLNQEAVLQLDNPSPVPVEFRTYENTSVFLSPSEVVNMCAAATMGGREIYKMSWIVQDSVRDATTVEEIPEIPETFKS